MKEIIEFLSASPAFFVATCGIDNAPHVRPFSFVMEWNGKLTFVTNTEKEVYKQLEENPRVEISSYSPSGEWMRIKGTVSFTKDAAAKEKVFEVMPALRHLYKEGLDEIMICFYIEDGEAGIYDMSSMNIPKRTIQL
ncbi:MAG: pyridoxamine 5'-phosphate oxidase family protein [Rikenellaceae bacterium]|nr:pyridoxamine 5'-phosphate oxidase family protein [Rikenellaceae bacterium]